jgi:Lon protease-like protein
MPRALPIFPLPLVLFPGAPQALHIFEPRYRQMLADCLAGDQRFGLTYDAHAGELAAQTVLTPGEVGCVAVIRSTQYLPDGRANILTEGEQRFVLLRAHPGDRLYHVADVEEFDDDPVQPGEADGLVTDVRHTFTRLARALGTLAGHDFDEPMELPTDPTALSFRVSATLELEAATKRALQAGRSTPERLRQLAALLGPLTVEAERRAAVRGRARRNGRGGSHAEIERAT